MDDQNDLYPNVSSEINQITSVIRIMIVLYYFINLSASIHYAPIVNFDNG